LPAVLACGPRLRSSASLSLCPRVARCLTAPLHASPAPLRMKLASLKARLSPGLPALALAVPLEILLLPVRSLSPLVTPAAQLRTIRALLRAGQQSGRPKSPLFPLQSPSDGF